jgi:GT2 family glycosyltransferase
MAKHTGYPKQAFLRRGFQVLKNQGLLEFMRRALGWSSNKLRLSGRSTPVILDDGGDYAAWIQRNEPGADKLQEQIEKSENILYRPLLSILTPVYNPDIDILRGAVSSVLAQTYSNWELCLVNGGSDQSGVLEVIQEFAARDARIRFINLDKNRGISGNTNAALEIARGEFVALLDQDDLLAPNALYEVVQLLNQRPDRDLIYSDHDMLSADGGRRYQPLFKPDWSPAVMLSANYITHLTVLRAALARELGGFDPQVDGAQDWDLFLRVSERSSKISHIPKILYHWRDSPNSTAHNIWAKTYAPEAQLSSITSHLRRSGYPQAQAFFDTTGYIRVKWAYSRELKVSIIIPSRGASQLLKRCVDSILAKTDYPNFEIIIVNNGPRQPDEFPYYQALSEDNRCKILHNEAPFNYSAANNYGAKFASGGILLFLNNDTEMLSPDWLDELVMWVAHAEVGIVGAKLLRPDGLIQHAGVIIGLTGFAGHIFGDMPEYRWSIFGLAEWYRDYMAVTGACLTVRSDVFDRLGGFDERLSLCGNDVELCLRARTAGLRVIYNPFARLLHLEGATRQGGDIPAEDYRASYHHYLPVLQSGDPYFNPNLSYWNLMPRLAGPDEQASLTFVNDFLLAQKGK